MLFWSLIVILALAVAGLIGRAMITGRQGAVSPAEYDLQVYRDQLKEVDRDLARGVLAEDEATRLRTEVSRRILAADSQLKAEHETGQSDSRISGGIMAALVALALVGGSWLIYDRLGAPGYRDVPIKERIAASDMARKSRLSQREVEASLPDTGLPEIAPEASPEFLALMEKLRETVAQRPDDIQGLTLLVRNEAALGNSKAAYEAQGRLLELRGDEATAQDYALYADLLITQARGYVSQEAEAALRLALSLNPTHPIARFYLAQYMLQVDRPDSAFRLLRDLLDDSPADAPWMPQLRGQIEEVAWRAGVNYELPPAAEAPGPDAAAVAEAETMSAEDRQAMIEGMVAQLSDRLATEGGTAEEWARLIRALSVLGDQDQARAIWGEAQGVFAGREAELNQVRAAAEAAGVAE